MNFGTWKASTMTCQSTSTARCTIRTIAKLRVLRAPSPATGCSLLPAAALPLVASLTGLEGSFNQLVDYGRSECSTRSATCRRRARRAARLDRSLPKIADSVGVFER
ncbi:hypothetical protein ACVW0I_003836 [Bradyrhizobium sp. LM6.11]